MSSPHDRIVAWLAGERRAGQVADALQALARAGACLAFLAVGGLLLFTVLHIPAIFISGFSEDHVVIVTLIATPVWLLAGMAFEWTRRRRRGAEVERPLMSWADDLRAGHLPRVSDTPLAMLRAAENVVLAPARFALAALALVDRARRPPPLDVDRCVEVIALVLPEPHRVPWERLVEQRPDLDADTLLPQLRRIRGVLVLEGEPADIWLTDRARAELGAS